MTNRLDFTCAAGCKHTVEFPSNMDGMTQEDICREITRQAGVPARLVESGRRDVTEWVPDTMERPITREVIDKSIFVDLFFHDVRIVGVIAEDTGERTDPTDDEVVCSGCGCFVERDQWCVGKDADAVQCEECGAVTPTKGGGDAQT